MYQQNTNPYHQSKQINFIIPHNGFDSDNWQSLIREHFDENALPYLVRIMGVFETPEPQPLCRVKPLVNEQGKLIGKFLVGIVSDYDIAPTWIRTKARKPAQFHLKQLPELFKRLYLISLAKNASERKAPQ